MALLRLFAPFLPFVCETLNDIMVGAGEGTAPTVHARGSWPKPEDHAAPNLDQAVGELVLEAVNAVRKTKSELQVSLRAPIAQLVIAPVQGGVPLPEIEAQLAPLLSDLKDVAAAADIVFEPNANESWPGSVSLGEKLRVSLKMAAPAETA
jgi:valyl-tRNA synthetase